MSGTNEAMTALGPLTRSQERIFASVGREAELALRGKAMENIVDRAEEGKERVTPGCPSTETTEREEEIMSKIDEDDGETGGGAESMTDMGENKAEKVEEGASKDASGADGRETGGVGEGEGSSEAGWGGQGWGGRRKR